MKIKIKLKSIGITVSIKWVKFQLWVECPFKSEIKFFSFLYIGGKKLLAISIHKANNPISTDQNLWFEQLLEAFHTCHVYSATCWVNVHTPH